MQIAMPAARPFRADATISPLTEADFGTIAKLGDTIWRTHYADIVSTAQLDYMLAGRYTAQNLSGYLNSDKRWMALLRVAGTPSGYLSYALTATPGEMKLEQIYLLPSLHGQGLGGLMLRHVEEAARVLGCTVLMLTVNKHNVNSIAVYKKSGFTVRESAVFDIGNGFVMDDYVMVKSLG